MKRIYFFAMLCMAFTSCSKDELSAESNPQAKAEIVVNDFSSEEKMEERIEEIVAIKSEKQKILYDNFNKINTSKRSNVTVEKVNELNLEQQNQTIVTGLKVYHSLVLTGIYELRKQLNFTSIQSIADEINSLIAVDANKSKELVQTYKSMIIKDPTIGIYRTIFDERTANVLNVYGEVLINGEKLNYRQYNNVPGETKRYIGDEWVTTAIAGVSENYSAYRIVGRELHKNSLGVKFFKYFTELKTYYGISVIPGNVVECPSNFIVEGGSYAGYVQTGSSFFSDYSFTYPFISGNGVSVRYTGGNKNTPYKPAGGQLKATFNTYIAGENREIKCDIKWRNE